MEKQQIAAAVLSFVYRLDGVNCQRFPLRPLPPVSSAGIALLREFLTRWRCAFNGRTAAVRLCAAPHILRDDGIGLWADQHRKY